jgi:hypothetical protein
MARPWRSGRMYADAVDALTADFPRNNVTLLKWSRPMMLRVLTASKTILFLCALLSLSAAWGNGTVQGFVYLEGTSTGLPGVPVEFDIGCLGPSGVLCAPDVLATTASDGSYTASVSAGTVFINA